MFSQLGSVDTAATLSPLLLYKFKNLLPPRHFISMCSKIVLVDRFCQNEMPYCHHWNTVTIIKIYEGNGVALEVVILCSAQSEQPCMHLSLSVA